jgi:hypothetical protein
MRGGGVEVCAVLRPLVLISTVAAAASSLAQPTPASISARPPAAELFERDWVLMNWALKFYDSDRDIMLEPNEAQVAANAFRKLADGDGDGRVTPQEYRAAREFILARY